MLRRHFLLGAAAASAAEISSFRQHRFGMFVHFGLYSIAAWHEQELYRKGLTRTEYAKYAARFNPAKFDPDAWLDLAAAAGMDYVTFTTKHIDGFCLWNTAETRFNITNTPYRRDFLKQLADACHRRNVPLSLYYSIADENHRNYPNRGRSYELPRPDPGDEPDEEKYVAAVKRQMTELCTQYGKIHGIWWDANQLKRQDPSVNALIRKLQPGILINNRGFDEGDFSTPERDWDNSVNTKPYFDKPVEACESIGYQSWGYRTDEDYYSDAYLIRNIQKILAKGGNYLLNIGPRADGTMPEEGSAILRRIGAWYRKVRPALHAEPAPGLTSNRNVVLTRAGNTIYVHLVDPPATTSVFLPPMTALPRRATLLNTGAPVEFDVEPTPRLFQSKPNRCLRLKHLPVSTQSTAGWVIALEMPA